MRPLLHHRRSWAALPALLLLVSLTAASCDEPLDIRTAQVSRASVIEIVDAPASVTARAAATLTAPADGTLATVSVRPGAQVRKGQVLARIDSPSARKQLRQAKQALEAAKRAGASGGGSINFGRAQQRLDAAAAKAFDSARDAADHIADPDLQASLLAQIEMARAQYAESAKAVAGAVAAVQRGVASLSSAMRALSQAQVMQARQAYDLAKATVNALTLRAPIDGVVQLGGASTASPAMDLSGLLSGASSLPDLPSTGQPTLPGVAEAPAVGAPISAGTAVITIVDLSEMGVVAEVDETDILLVEPGISAEAELDAAPGVSYPATVEAIDVLPTPNSRGAVAYRVHLRLLPAADGQPTPRPGMSAVVRLQVREAAGTLTVPVAAVFTVEGRDMIWVRRSNGAAERRPVRVGVSGVDTLEILDGVFEGETVVVRGVDLVREGDRLP